MHSDRIDPCSLLTDGETARVWSRGQTLSELSGLLLILIRIKAAPTAPVATAIALHHRKSGSLRKLPISS